MSRQNDTGKQTAGVGAISRGKVYQHGHSNEYRKPTKVCHEPPAAAMSATADVTIPAAMRPFSGQCLARTMIFRSVPYSVFMRYSGWRYILD